MVCWLVHVHCKMGLCAKATIMQQRHQKQQDIVQTINFIETDVKGDPAFVFEQTFINVSWLMCADFKHDIFQVPYEVLEMSNVLVSCRNRIFFPWNARARKQIGLS